jgi:hypothetical protein
MLMDFLSLLQCEGLLEVRQQDATLLRMCHGDLQDGSTVDILLSQVTTEAIWKPIVCSEEKKN